MFKNHQESVKHKNLIEALACACFTGASTGEVAETDWRVEGNQPGFLHPQEGERGSSAPRDVAFAVFLSPGASRMWPRCDSEPFHEEELTQCEGTKMAWRRWTPTGDHRSTGANAGKQNFASRWVDPGYRADEGKTHASSTKQYDSEHWPDCGAPLVISHWGGNDPFGLAVLQEGMWIPARLPNHIAWSSPQLPGSGFAPSSGKPWECVSVWLHKSVLRRSSACHRRPSGHWQHEVESSSEREKDPTGRCD